MKLTRREFLIVFPTIPFWKSGSDTKKTPMSMATGGWQIAHPQKGGSGWMDGGWSIGANPEPPPPEPNRYHFPFVRVD